MKPMGMSPTMRIIKPTAAEDAIWAAVEAAVEEGMMPRQFRLEVAEAWEEKLRDEVKGAVAELKKEMR